MAIFPDILPHTFTIQEATDLLKWQGSPQGLAHSLKADGFSKFRVVGATPGAPMRTVWRRPVADAVACSCRCHTGTCGANDMDLAERAIRLVEMLRPLDVKMIEEIQYLVNRAGVDHAKAALNPVDLDDDVPF